MTPETAQNVVITNPLQQDINVQIQAKLISMEDASFSFRTTKVKTDDGREVDWKRPTLKAKIPLLTTAGLIAALQAGDKSTDLALELCNSGILDRARGIINEAIDANPKVELTQDILDMSKLSFVAIANLPKSERGAGIPKEAWASFVADYKAVMQTAEAIAMFPDKRARSPEVLDKHGILLAGKFNQVRSRKDTVGQMLGFLDIWVQNTPNAEEHLACYEHLKAKGEAILQGESFEDL